MREVNSKNTELKKSLGLLDYFSLGFGTIVGAGWVIMVGTWLKSGGGLGTPIAFALGGLLLLSVGSCYGEMCAAMPVAGGSVTYCQLGLGQGAAFAAGWMLAGGYIFICPWEAIAVGKLATFLLPALASGRLYSVGGEAVFAPQLALGAVLVLTTAFLNYRGVEFGMRFQKVLALTLMLLTGSFIIVGLLRGRAENLQPLFVGASPGVAIAGVFSVLSVVPFFMAGFESIPQAAEEAAIHVPRRRFGFVILACLTVAAVFYALITLVVGLLVPRQTVVTSELPTAKAFAICFASPLMGKLVVTAAIVGLCGTLNGCFLAATRVILGMARAGLLPRSLSNISPSTRTPTRAIGLVMAISLVLTLLGRSILSPIVNVAAVFFLVVWTLVAVSCFRLRAMQPDLVRPFKVPYGRAVATIAFTFTGGLVLLVCLPVWRGSLRWPMEYLTLLVWVVAGSGLYVWRRGMNRSIDRGVSKAG